MGLSSHASAFSHGIFHPDSLYQVQTYFTTSANCFFEDLGPKGKLVNIDFEDEDVEIFGVATVGKMTWKDMHNRQVWTTGQTVTPKPYVACGISGAIQHLAGMKKSEFIVAVNTDKDTPIAEEADVLVIADLKKFIPVLIDKIQNL